MSVIAYEDKLNADRRWALREGSMHFEKDSGVFRTLRQIAQRLDAIGVPYAVCGGMALFQHGYRRFTDDVDILVTPEGLKTLHARLEGLGYLPPFAGSKNLRDTDTGVKIEFLVTGGFPGDGKPKPVAFPDPADVFVDLDGIKCLSLPALVQLKLASGTASWRMKDLADVQEVIRIFGLDESFAEQIDPSVREVFGNLLAAVRAEPQE